MFCPRCSQQQVSDNVRFCSRCGFQLNIVKALLFDDEELLSKTSGFIARNSAQRKRDMAIGAVLMLFFALHSAWTTEDLSLEREYTSLVLKCLIICVLINIVPAIRDFFRRKAALDNFSPPNILSRLAVRFKGDDRNHAVTLPAYSRPATDYFTGSINTAELIPPPSVTEETTNLLSRNSN